jgi:hypothetical protein
LRFLALEIPKFIWNNQNKHNNGGAGLVCEKLRFVVKM